LPGSRLGITQKEKPIAWGKMKDRENQRRSKLGLWKNCKMEKKLYANPKRKSWNTVIAKESCLIGLFNCSKKMVASSNPHATSISSTTIPEAITQKK